MKFITKNKLYKKFGLISMLYIQAGLYKINDNCYYYCNKYVNLLLSSKELNILNNKINNILYPFEYMQYNEKSINDLINNCNYKELVNYKNNLIKLNSKKMIGLTKDSNNEYKIDLINYLNIDIQPLIDCISNIIDNFENKKIPLLNKNYINQTIIKKLKSNKKCLNFYKNDKNF